MPRFLHTADWQIGRQYSRFEDEDAAILADARFRAVERLAALAHAEQVDAILVAGDVFDAQTVSDRTLHRCFQVMAQCTRPWLLIPGNHDAALAESVWTRAQRLGAVADNIHVLTTPQVTTFADSGFAVLPAPLTQRHTNQDLTAWFDQAETPASLVRIGLAHGSINDQLAAVADSPNPIAADRAASAGLDYLALGDWHGYQRIDAHTAYSGTPEPDRFRNNDTGQALIVDIDAAGDTPTLTRHEVAQYQWFQWQRELLVASDPNELLAELRQLPDMSVVDLTLTGQLDLEARRQLRQALSVEAGRHRSLNCDLSGLRLQPTDADIAALHADGYVDTAIDVLRAQQADDGPQADTAREALALLADMLHEQTAETAACN